MIILRDGDTTSNSPSWSSQPHLLHALTSQPGAQIRVTLLLPGSTSEERIGGDEMPVVNFLSLLAYVSEDGAILH